MSTLMTKASDKLINAAKQLRLLPKGKMIKDSYKENLTDVDNEQE